MSATEDLEVKLAFHLKHVRDVSYWKLPEGTPIVAHPDVKQLGDAPIGSKFLTGSPDQPNYKWTKTGSDEWKSGEPGDTRRRIAYTNQLAELQGKTALVTPTRYGGAKPGEYVNQRDQEALGRSARPASPSMTAAEFMRHQPRSERLMEEQRRRDYAAIASRRRMAATGEPENVSGPIAKDKGGADIHVGHTVTWQGAPNGATVLGRGKLKNFVMTKDNTTGAVGEQYTRLLTTQGPKKGVLHRQLNTTELHPEHPLVHALMRLQTG